MKDKQFYMAQELGRAQGRIKQLEASVEHYGSLVGERTRALHAAKREIRRLKRELRLSVNETAALPKEGA